MVSQRFADLDLVIWEDWPEKMNDYQIIWFQKGIYIIKNKKQYGDLAAYNQGKYYLCCKLDFGDDEYFTVENYLANHNCIMIMDVDTHKYSLVRGVEITDFANKKDMSNQDILAVVYSTFQSYRVAMVTDSGAIYNAPKLK